MVSVDACVHCTNVEYGVSEMGWVNEREGVSSISFAHFAT